MEFRDGEVTERRKEMFISKDPDPNISDLCTAIFVYSAVEEPGYEVFDYYRLCFGEAKFCQNTQC